MQNIKSMTEKDLKELGFKKVKVSPEESGDIGYYFYEYTFGKYNYAFDLVSSTSDESQKGWSVNLFESNLKALTKSQVKKYINLINELI